MLKKLNIFFFLYCRWAVIGAMMTTSMAVSLIVYGSILDAETCMKNVTYPDIVPSK